MFQIAYLIQTFLSVIFNGSTLIFIHRNTFKLITNDKCSMGIVFVTVELISPEH